MRLLIKKKMAEINKVEISKSGLDDKLGIVLISIKDKKIEIAKVNRAFLSMVEENDEDNLIGISPNKFMPANIAANHDSYIVDKLLNRIAT
jgi:hypothetical protein